MSTRQVFPREDDSGVYSARGIMMEYQHYPLGLVVWVACACDEGLHVLEDGPVQSWVCHGERREIRQGEPRPVVFLDSIYKN
mgnify:CR=1 FL=1